MTEQECLEKMVAPGTHRPGKYGSDKGFGGVVQIHVTRACDLSCWNCTQASNLGGRTGFMTADQMRAACRSLKDYPGIVGMFGGNPAIAPNFRELCAVMREEAPKDRLGIWCNNPITVSNAVAMRNTFNPAVSNLNVHLDRAAFDKFKEGWPECNPCGLTTDSRHSPPWVAMKDVVKKECPDCNGRGGHWNGVGLPRNDWDCDICQGKGTIPDDFRIWELISGCDINKHWSAMIGVFRGQLRAWFCEIAGAQAMLHQDEPDCPDTGSPLWARVESVQSGECFAAGDVVPWWMLGMDYFAGQVRKHCFDCGVPLRGHGENAMTADEAGVEQVSATHEGVYRPKRRDRKVQVVTELVQLGSRLDNVTKYLANSLR